MLRIKLSLVFVAAFAIGGCTADAEEAPAGPAGVDDPQGSATGDEEAATATDDVTALKYYDCRSDADFDTMARMEIGLSATKMDITDVSKDAAPPDTGRIDNSYEPSATYAGAVRYQGYPKIHDAFSGSDVAHIEFIVSKELKAKAASGKLWMRTSGSGGDTTQFYCKSKSAKLKVVTSKKARLACDLKHLICTNDNPPGETCLGDVFINQTTNEQATAKLTYLEHFGVNVHEKKVTLSASDVSRTTKKYEGNWSGTTLKLEYRGGVTYTGKFKLADGRTEDVQCNDLAMFD